MSTDDRLIALVMQHFSGGGIERVMINLCNEMCRIGQPVELVVVRGDGPMRDRVADPSCIVDLGCSKTMYSLGAMTRYMRRRKPAAVLSAMPHVNVVTVLASKLARSQARVFVSEHSDVAHERQVWLRPVKVASYLSPWIYPWATGIVTVSHGVGEKLIPLCKLEKSDVFCIYNPIVSDQLLESSKQPPQHPWLREADVPVVVAMGRLEPQKAFDSLIQAFAIARAKRPMKLIIFGEGSLRGELETMVSTLELQADVSLPGFTDNPFAELASASLFVLSSRWEGFGNVIVEAMACGVPVVSTNCPSGPSEILEDGKYGGLVAVDDHEQLAAAMLDALEAPNDASVLKQRADYFSVEKVTQRYRDLLLDGRIDPASRVRASAM